MEVLGLVNTSIFMPAHNLQFKLFNNIRLVIRVHQYFLHVHPLRDWLGARPARTPRRAAGGIVSVRVQLRGQG